MKKLLINPQVYDDLLEIKNYIAEDSAEQAHKIVAKIICDLERLKDFPESGAKLSNKVSHKTKYRYVITFSYASLYYIEKDCVIVTNVIHMARDFATLKLDN